MKTTLNTIKKYHPCESGWKTLLKSLNKTIADDDEIELMYILKSNGIKDAVWCLRCFNYLDYCLFLAEVAESVLHIYESKNTNPAPRNAIAAIREYKLGNIDKQGLIVAAGYAAAATASVVVAADYAVAAAAYAAAGAGAGAATADYAAAAAAATADYAAVAAVAATTSYAAAAAATAYTADYAAKKDKKWLEIEQLFIKHFGA